MGSLLATLLEEAFSEIQAARGMVSRSVKFSDADNMIKVAIGMRRSGKTYALYEKIHQLLDSGVEQSSILFIDFEDDRLLPLSTKKMGALVDEFYSMYPQNHQNKCYLFLDEVQNVDNWHQVVRRIFKSKSVELYITGSSAKLLSTEINTSLRGRSLATEILPYSFREYRLAHDLPEPVPPYGRQSFDAAQIQMRDYFKKGGFPAVQDMQSHDWRETLQSYVDTVILRDVIERHSLSNVQVLKYLTKSLLVNTAAPFSVSKFFNDAKSQGYKLSRETVYSYMEYLEDAFLILRVPIYTESIRVRQANPGKIYAIDNGLIHAYNLGIHDVYNKFLENQVYLDLRRDGREIYYYKTKSGYEIDFITIDKLGKKVMIQVCWDLSDLKTLDREKRALMEAEKELGIKGYIITAESYSIYGIKSVPGTAII